MPTYSTGFRYGRNRAEAELESMAHERRILQEDGDWTDAHETAYLARVVELNAQIEQQRKNALLPYTIQTRTKREEGVI